MHFLVSVIVTFEPLYAHLCLCLCVYLCVHVSVCVYVYVCICVYLNALGYSYVYHCLYLCWPIYQLVIDFIVFICLLQNIL